MSLSWHSQQESNPCFLFDAMRYDPMTEVLTVRMSKAAVTDEGYQREYTYHGVSPALAQEFITAKGDRKLELYPQVKDAASATVEEDPDRHGTEPWEPSP